ncbi:MAG: EAL domain-containing protein, partial [Burkholderiales bacterium]|nr:EAL domain-containing protein [Burkholderiales bacterium]
MSTVIPSREILRLADLADYRVAVETPDDDLNQLAALTARLLRCPIAGISLVDDRHVWLKGRFGVEADCLLREGAFCSYAIESNAEFFCVADTARDLRFAHNALVVAEPHVRMYASAVLHSPAGYPVGTLWVMDQVARELPDFERAGLLALGTHAAHLLQKRRRNAVTGLPSRETFVAQLQCALGRAGTGDAGCRDADCAHRAADGSCRSGNAAPPATVGFIALQNLALVRSAYGEKAARLLLRRLSEQLQDWAGPGNLLAHLDGDHFGFALLMDHAQARQNLARLEAMLTHPVAVDGMFIYAPCSVGASIAPSRQALASALLDQAAVAASTASLIEPGAVRLYDPATHDSTRQWVDFQRSFPEDIASRRIFPWYQPQVDAASGRIVGFEALARLRHPTQGVIGPGAFLALAAHTGLSHMMDMCILEAVC